MKPLFLLSLLAGALFYTYHGFHLSYLTRTGRMGPGFFPQIIGVILLVVILYSLVMDRRIAATPEPSGDSTATETQPSTEVEPKITAAVRWRDTLLMVGLATGFVWSLTVLGGVLAMIFYIFVTLLIFNRGRHLRNIAVSVVVPILIYLLFSVWLSSPIPEGMIAIGR